MRDFGHVDGFDSMSQVDRRSARSSSFNLSTMMNQLAPSAAMIQLLPGKRFMSYNLPNGSHLLFKSMEGRELGNEWNFGFGFLFGFSVDHGEKDKPVFTGEKHFIRVYDEAGSYKTIVQPRDTNAKYLYDELAEKFNLTNTQDYRIFLMKNGVGEYILSLFVCFFG